MELLKICCVAPMFACFLVAQSGVKSNLENEIKALGYDSSSRQIRLIASYPKKMVVPLLLRHLSSIDSPVVYEDEIDGKNLPSFTSECLNDRGIHVLMCIKTLEYISSIRFTASAECDFDVDFEEEPDLEDRVGLIHANGSRSNIYKNYYHWESHLKYFLPPVEAQKKIISKWNSWWITHKTK